MKYLVHFGHFYRNPVLMLMTLIFFIVLNPGKAYCASPARWAFNTLDTRYYFKPKFYCIGQNGAVLSGEKARNCCNYDNNTDGIHWPPQSGSAYKSGEGCPENVDGPLLLELMNSVAASEPPPNRGSNEYLRNIGGSGANVIDIAPPGSKLPPLLPDGQNGNLDAPSTSGPTREAAVANLSAPDSTPNDSGGQLVSAGGPGDLAGSGSIPEPGAGAAAAGGQGGGSSGGSNGGGSTGPMEMGQTSSADPSDLTNPTDEGMSGSDPSGSSYGGGGGGGTRGGGGGGDGPDLFGAFGSLFGAKKDGPGTGDGKELQFGNRNSRSAGSGTGGSRGNAIELSNNPADYFDRTASDDDLFKIIETKYKQKALLLGTQTGTPASDKPKSQGLQLIQPSKK
jgi:hypothetical protein